MTATATKAAAFKDAMVAAAHTLWDVDEPEVMISFGHPGGGNQPDDIVAFTRVVSNQEPGPISTRRARDEELTLEVHFSIYRGGRGNAVEKLCSDRGYKLLGDLENYVRTTDTTLGGVVTSCFLTAHDSDGETDAAFLVKGRLIEIRAVFTAQARITN